MNNECLFKDADFVGKAFVHNISEGGVLLGDLKQVPSGEQFTVFLEIPQLPDFTKLSTGDIIK